MNDFVSWLIATQLPESVLEDSHRCHTFRADRIILELIESAWEFDVALDGLVSEQIAEDEL